MDKHFPTFKFILVTAYSEKNQIVASNKKQDKDKQIWGFGLLDIFRIGYFRLVSDLGESPKTIYSYYIYMLYTKLVINLV